MGQKINSTGLRLLLNKNWFFKSYVDSSNYSEVLYQDFYVRDYISNLLLKYNIFISKVLIKRSKSTVHIYIYFYNDFKFDKSFYHFFRKVRRPRYKYYHEYQKYILDYKKTENPSDLNLSKYVSLRKIILLNISFFLKSRVVLHTRNTFLWNKKINKKIWLLNKKLRSPLKLNDSLKLIFLIRSSLIFKTPFLLANYLSVILNKHIKKSFRFFNFIQKILEEFMYVYNLRGVCICFKGRFSGSRRVRRSRKFIIRKGKIPSHSLSAKVSYVQKDCITLLGICNIKIWFYF